MLAFVTESSLDLNMLRFMGVSVKETESPIGYFGTGLKYAIAVLLRTGHKVELRLEGKPYHFSVGEKTFRGESHKIILMESPGGQMEELPFTLNYGRNWQVWMAYRELVTNTIDEGGAVTEGPVYPPDGTVWLISGDQIMDCHAEKEKYFLSPDKMGELSSTISVHRSKGKPGVFYHGVRVGDMPRAAKHSYEIKGSLKLTEDRTIAEPQQLWQQFGIATACHCRDRGLIKAMIQVQPMEEYFESSLDYLWSNPSADFMEVCKGLVERNLFSMARSALATYEKETQKSFISTMEMTGHQRAVVGKAVDLLKRCGWPEIDRYPILLMKNGSTAQLGQAKDGQIYLTELAFTQGVKGLMATILEEWLHLNYGFDDCSREFQDWLLTKVVDLLEEHVLQEVI